MRSSKSRSRSKSNRPRSMGNIVNRVFDSSGPEGKVRGTPQQIIEKYLFLARDAQLSNDRVAAENFLQHAEHYTRMLGEAQRELAAEQEARQQQQGGNGNGHNRDRQERGDFRGDRGDYRPEFREPRETVADEQPEVGAPAYMADAAGEDSMLVETPESRPRERDDRSRSERTERDGRSDRPRSDRREGERREDRRDERREPRGEKPATDRRPPREAAPTVTEAAPAPTPAPEPVATENVAEKPVPAKADTPAKPAPKPRAPRKPKAKPEDGGTPSGEPQEAAE